MEFILIFITIILIAITGLAVLLLKGFDRIAGRGPGQVANGMREHYKGK